MSKIQVILNPAADRGHARELAPQIKAWLCENGEVGWAETTRPGQATELAARACEEGYDVVVAAGGDGTAQEVINGLMEARGAAGGGQGETGRSALGLIPIGSGNDFAWMVGVAPGVRRTRDLALVKAAVERIRAGQTRMIDLGRICDGTGACRYFDNGVGIGFDAIVNAESRKLKPLRGFAMYLAAVLKTMACTIARRRRFSNSTDNASRSHLLMISVANGRRYGGGFYVTPQAELDDGLFDICFVDQVSRVEMLKLMTLFMKGTQAANPHVHMTRARRVTRAL